MARRRRRQSKPISGTVSGAVFADEDTTKVSIPLRMRDAVHRFRPRFAVLCGLSGFDYVNARGTTIMSDTYESKSGPVSVLGPTLLIKGELSADEDILLRGRVEGSIRHSSKLTIGQEGSVQGDIKAKCIIVDGRVEGDLHATASITINSTAKVEGNMSAPTISLIEGARIKGSIETTDSGPAAQTPKPARAVSRDNSDPETALKVAASAS